MNSQRQGNAPAKRLGYTGIAFYDLKDPSHPEFLSRIDLDPGQRADNTYFDSSGVHHGFFDGRYAYFGGGEAGIIGHHLVIVDAKDPRHPKIVGRWWVPGQKTPEEDAIRIDNTTTIDPVTGLTERLDTRGRLCASHDGPDNGLLTKDIFFPLHRCPAS